MPALLAAHDFVARDPIELDHSPRAGKGLVTMPRIVAALEREERPLDRRHLEDHVIEIGSRFQQSQPSPSIFPSRVQVKQHGVFFR